MSLFKTTLVIAAVVGWIATSGCMKTPEPNEEFGPEFSVDDLNTALGNAQYSATSKTVMNIQVGELASFEKTSRVEVLDPVIISAHDDSVSGVDTSSNKRTIFTVTHVTNEMDGATGAMKPSQSQSTACLELLAGGCDSQTELATPSSANSSGGSVADATNYQLKAKDVDPPNTLGAFSGRFNDLSWKSIVQQAASSSAANGTKKKWTYHNLKKFESTIEQPSQLYKRQLTGCGGRKVCNVPMHTYEVTFTEVDWQSENFPVKYEYDLVFSDEAPFFAAQVKSCGSTTIPYMGQRVSIQQCEYVKDFNVGTPPTPVTH